MVTVFAWNPIDLWLGLCWNWVSNRNQDKSRCMNYFYNNHWCLESWVMRKEERDLIFHCLNYSPTGNKLQHLENTYLNEEALATLKQEAKEISKKRYTLGMNFNMSVKRKGGCLSGFFVIGKGDKRPEIYITIKTYELPKKGFADLLFIREILRRLDIEYSFINLYVIAAFYWTLPVGVFIPIFGRKNISNPQILNSGFYQNRYEYRGVRSLHENNEAIAKEYGKEVLEKGFFYLGEEGLWKLRKEYRGRIIS